MKRILLAATAVLALAACNEAENAAPAAEAVADAPAAASDDLAAPAAPAAEPTSDRAAAEAASAPAVRRAPPAAPAAPSGPVLPKLAYSHRAAIEVPSRSVAMLVEKHEDACLAAGPARCQVTGENVRQQSRNVITGELTLRAEAVWLEGFRKGLAADAQATGGRLVTNSTDTEELSRAMIDADAAVAAKTAMRDRLQEMVRTRKGTLEDVMDVERELAQVQAEIDAARANLADMRGRVAMSQITIEYGPKAGLVQDGAWSPVGQAVRASQGVMATTVAVIILAASVLIPVGAVIWAFVWGILRLNRRRKPAVSAEA